jgi:hypothetical protein
MTISQAMLYISAKKLFRRTKLYSLLANLDRNSNARKKQERRGGRGISDQ